MHTSTLTLIPSLLGLALAKPISRQSSPTFTITDLSATYPYPFPPYGLDEVDSHLTISVTYPTVSDPTATTSTTCTISWPKGTPPAPSSTWTPCSDPTLEFRLPVSGWSSDTHFTVEFWETTSSEGAGLQGSTLLTSGPADPSGKLFCIQKGKFNPLTCTFNGPFGSTQNTVVIPAVEESQQPA
ncbi:hypothetical protein F5Y18DRAFT_71007 [Xylariaceae sp. FL1019]|nr:hypothetical protein F5Y18DRAFT_71007 [Xylariaceae sp. FL1019]